MEIHYKHYKLIQEEDRFNLEEEVETTIKTKKQAKDFGKEIGDKTGKKVWQSHGYSMLLENALKKIVFLEVNSMDSRLKLDEFMITLQKEYKELKDVINQFKTIK